MNINNDDLLLEFFSKITTRKDHNNTSGGLLIYFKDISVERVTGLQNNVDDLGDHAHHFNPSKSDFSFHLSGEYSSSIRY